MKKIVALFLIACSSVALAETVNFNGTYPTNACQFISIQPGSMGINAQSPLNWSTLTGAGQSAQLSLAYIGEPTLTVNAVSGFSLAPGAIPNGTTYNTKASLGLNGVLNSGAYFDTGSKDKVLSSSYSNDTLYLDLAVQFGSQPLSGDYTASTTVTCM